MFREILNNLPEKLSDFTPFVIGGKADITSLSARTKIELMKRGEKYLHYSYPQIPATSYMEFCRTGNRTRFEDLYMSRRSVLNTLVMAEFAEGKGRFLDDVINGIFALCEESGWQLPAHNSYIRDTPQQILPDLTAPVLDLFACETGAQLAMIRYLLRGELDSVSPVISDRILHEIQTRIVTPYLNRHFWWMGNGDEPMCNWTAWCTQNVLIAVFATSQPQEIKVSTVKKAAYSLDCFLKDYGDDGCCEEGAQYYRHAGLCLFNAMEVLNAVTQNAFTGLYQNEKIKNIAAYIVNMHVDDIYYFNFADCSPVAGRAGVREFLFGKRVKNEAVMTFAFHEWKKSKDYDLPNEINLFYRMQAVFTTQEIENYVPHESGQTDIYYPSVGIFITRDSTFALAVKAGNNGDSHNHNDTGSFTVYKKGLPFLIDVGVENYTKKTFSPERYGIWTMQSAYHNLPTFGGVMQKDGSDYAAKDVKISFTPIQSDIEMDIAPAYPADARVNQYIRHVTLHKGKNITVEDRFSGPCHEATLSLMVCDKPEIGGQTIAVGNIGIIKTDRGSQVNNMIVEEIPITNSRLRAAWPETIWRIRITFQNHIALTIPVN